MKLGLTVGYWGLGLSRRRVTSNRSRTSAVPVRRLIPPDENIPDWTQDVFGLASTFIPTYTAQELRVVVAPGPTTVEETFVMSQGENAPEWHVHWKLTKECSLGGTAC